MLMGVNGLTTNRSKVMNEWLLWRTGMLGAFILVLLVFALVEALREKYRLQRHGSDQSARAMQEGDPIRTTPALLDWPARSSNEDALNPVTSDLKRAA
jgi:hypothetical protein